MKTFTVEEIDEIINQMYVKYTQHYTQGKMNFNELILIEHIVMTIQNEFQKKIRDEDGAE